MPPPTHPHSCVTLTCHPTGCSKCGEGVYYFSCTCGSKVFFDTLFPDWWQHECVEHKPPAVPQRKSEPLLVECPRCGSRVSPDRLFKHAKRINEYDRSLPSKVEGDLYTVCRKPFLNGNIVSHVTHVHGLTWCTRRNERKASRQKRR
jgi:DNA-directed RNA polymerase subunit RPC12/RpoP